MTTTSLRSSISWLASSLAVALACDGEPDSIDDHVLDRGGVGSTIKFNTSEFEDIDTLDTTGQFWGGTRLLSVALSCAQVQTKPPNCEIASTFVLDKVSSVEGELQGSLGDAKFHGDDFIDSEWKISQFMEIFEVHRALRITKHIVDTESGPAETHYYWFWYLDYYNQWKPACPDQRFASVLGGRVAVLGDLTVHTYNGSITSRPNTLYLACTDGAVGKAVVWGYRPWELGVKDFTTAVRIIRADYCGDGTSWTKPATAFQLRDVWHINEFFEPLAQDEAIWDDWGAICVSHPRIPVVPTPLQGSSGVVCNDKPVPLCTANAFIPFQNDETPPLAPSNRPWLRKGRFWTKRSE